MNLDELITKYRENGYSLADARSTVCQDIVLNKIAKSNFKAHITVKGGVVMHNISNSSRRATQDLDLDFIRYSLKNEAIMEFIKRLNKTKDGIQVIVEGNIEDLNHQDYDGKRVYIRLIDNYNNYIDSKLDIGVHKNFDIEQDEYYFNLASMKDSVCLLINSKEQIFTEKLKSLLKFGVRSTRYKDLFDFYYLISETKLNKTKLIKNIDILIFEDKSIYENNFNDIRKRLNNIFKSPVFKRNLDNPKANWLDVNIDVVIKTILNYIVELEETIKI